MPFPVPNGYDRTGRRKGAVRTAYIAAGGVGMEPLGRGPQGVASTGTGNAWPGWYGGFVRLGAGKSPAVAW